LKPIKALQDLVNKIDEKDKVLDEEQL